MKLTNIVFCLTLLAGAATSCIREDLDDCLSTNTLLLSYKGDGTTEIFPDKICRVEMFVFDAENRCVNSSILPEEQVKGRTATLPPLAAGDYRIVCLGNTHHTKVDGIASGDFGRMLLPPGIISTRNRLPATIHFTMLRPLIPYCLTAVMKRQTKPKP